MRNATLSLAIVLALAACSGISTSADWDQTYDFGRLSSYAWVEQDLEGGVSEIMLRRMYLAVDDELAAKGFEKTERELADFLLAYHTGTQTRQQYDPYGYGAGGWWGGYWVADVQILALQGKRAEALAALGKAVEEGWRSLWWYYLRHDPNLELIRDEPEFQSAIAAIEIDMAAQMQRVREMERSGEIAAIPGIVFASE